MKEDFSFKKELKLEDRRKESDRILNEYTNRNLNEMASQIGKHISVLVEYQIDETGNFDFITVQRCNGFSWKEIFNDIQSGVLLLDCCNDYTYLDTDDFNYGYQLGKKLINK